MGSPVRLEVDPSIIEKNLLIIDRDSSPTPEQLDPFVQFFNKSEDKNPSGVPYITIRPSPGFCVKTHTVDKEKVFVNVCHTDVIQPPKDVSDEELISILESDEAPTYTIPLSMGSVHFETDKNGNPCKVYDVAISTTFFQKILKNELFKTFFMVVVLEGLESKYKLEMPPNESKSYIILKNRKQIGTLQMHNIEKRPVRTEPPKKMIEVISSSSTESKKPIVQSITGEPVEGDGKLDLSVDDTKVLRLFAVPKEGDPLLLLALAKVKALSGDDIELDVGVRRLVVACARNNTIDCVLPYSVQPDKIIAQYFVNLQVLKVCLLISKDATDYQKDALNDMKNLRELKRESRRDELNRSHLRFSTT